MLNMLTSQQRLLEYLWVQASPSRTAEAMAMPTISVIFGGGEDTCAAVSEFGIPSPKSGMTTQLTCGKVTACL